MNWRCTNWLFYIPDYSGLALYMLVSSFFEVTYFSLEDYTICWMQKYKYYFFDWCTFINALWFIVLPENSVAQLKNFVHTKYVNTDIFLFEFAQLSNDTINSFAMPMRITVGHGNIVDNIQAHIPLSFCSLYNKQFIPSFYIQSHSSR